MPVLNLFVRMLAETGFLGGFLFLLWHFRILRSAWEAISLAPNGEKQLMSAALFVTSIAVMIGYFGESGFDKRFWPFGLGLSVAWARLVVLASAREKVLPERASPKARVWRPRALVPAARM